MKLITKATLAPARAPRDAPASRTGFAAVAAAMGLGLGLAASTASAEFREFTSPTGAKMTAELVGSLGDGKIKIRRTNGQEIVVNVSAFSKEDQAFIANWIKTSPFAVNYSFDISVDEVKLDTKKTEDTSEKMTIEQTAYEVAITNRARGKVEGLKVVYKVFMEDRVSDYGSHLSDPGLLYKEGEAEIPPLAYNRTARFQTKTHKVQRVRQKYGFYDKSNERDRMKGVWIRFFKGDTMVHEWKSEGVPVEDWDFKPERRGSTAPGVNRDPEPDPAIPVPRP